MNARDLLSGMKRVLLIHHWDTDGICSASLLRDELKDAYVSNRVPRIGTYRISQRILNKATHEWDAIIVVDIRLPDNEFKILQEVASCEVMLLDHHIGKTPAGVVRLQSEDEEPLCSVWPSTSWLVKESLGLPPNLRSILGLVGDKGSIELPDGPKRDEVMHFLSGKGLDERSLCKITDLLDSNYRAGDETLVELAVGEMSKIGENAKAMLTHPLWTRNTETLEDEIGRQLERPGEPKNGMVVKKFDSRFDIVSAVGRKLAWSDKWRVVVAVNTGFLSEQDQVYIRRGTGIIDAPAIIQMAKDRGYSAGGKDEVVGVVVPKNEAGEYLDELVAKLAG